MLCTFFLHSSNLPFLSVCTIQCTINEILLLTTLKEKVSPTALELENANFIGRDACLSTWHHMHSQIEILERLFDVELSTVNLAIGSVHTLF